MNRLNTIIRIEIEVLLMTMLPFSSCQRNTESSDSYSRINVETSVNAAGNVQAGTRAANTGTSLTDFGLFLCRHWDPASGEAANPYDEYSRGTNNIKYDNGKYTLHGSTVSASSLFLCAPEDESGAKIGFDAFAYSPYSESVTTPEEIPVSLTAQLDYMWAVENSDPTSYRNCNIIPDGTDKTLYMHFNHAMSLLNIVLRLNDMPNEDIHKSPSHLHSIEMKLSEDAETRLYQAGVLNAATGIIAPSDPIEGGGSYLHSITPASFNANTELVVPILIIPSTYQRDGDIELVFTIDNTEMPATYLIRRADLEHSDGTYGFRAGYKYTFNFVYDNYLHISSVSVSHDWTENPAKEIKV